MLNMENPVVFLLATGTVLTEIGILGYIGTKILHKYTDIDLKIFSRVEQIVNARYREIGLILATLATSGSLYLSNMLGWTPCHLCWFQRIFMYPLVILFGVSLFLDRKDVADYVIPVAMTGGAISVYHYLIQFLPKLQSASCSISEVSCQSTYTFYYWHITIPIMAAVAFTGILLACLTNYWKE